MLLYSYDKLSYFWAIIACITVTGGRVYLLTFDETKGHQQTNSATGTSRALKRQLRAPIPMPAPAPAPASPHHVAPPAPAPYTGTTPSSLYDAIQLSYHTAQWGFYSDAGKYVPFKPDQSKVKCFGGCLYLPLLNSEQRRYMLILHYGLDRRLRRHLARNETTTTLLSVFSFLGE